MNKTERGYINKLRAAYASVDRIDTEHFDKLKNIIRLLPERLIVAIADSDIRFCNTAANSHLVDVGKRPESARWEHAIDIVTNNLMKDHCNRATA